MGWRRWSVDSCMMAILRKIFMVHNTIRMMGESDKAVSQKTERQLYAKTEVS
jgi:hypothetical protein